MHRIVLIIALVFSTTFSFSQGQIGETWQIGIGGAIVKFNEKDVAWMGDKHLIQAPRFNVTKRINNDFSVDAALAFGVFDSETKFIVRNNVPYFSLDISGRYSYYKGFKKLDPYVFVGASIVDSDSKPDRKTTPTFNIGTGFTYWFSEIIGVSSNLYYKHSLDSFESMRSHIQGTLGIVFGINSKTRGKGSSSRNGSTRCYYDQHIK